MTDYRTRIYQEYGSRMQDAQLIFNPNSLERLLALVGFSNIAAREAGPVVHGAFSLGRYVIWKIIRSGLTVWNLAETGSKGSGVYTRVFLITGRKVEA